MTHPMRRSMDEVLAAEIKQATTRQFLTNLGVVILVALIIWGYSKYYYNFIYGPFSISSSQLSSISNPNSIREYFITVKGDTIFDSGFTQIEKQVDNYTKKVTSQSAVGYYQLLLVNDRLLIVLTEHQSTSKQWVGTLVPVPDDLRKNLIEDPELKISEMCLPIMLDTAPFRRYGYVGLAILIPALAISLWNIYSSVRRLVDPSLHPIHKTFERRRLQALEMQSTDYDALTPRCDNCGDRKKVLPSTFHYNVSYLFRRQERTIQGKYCLPCTSRLFLQFTGITLIGTWWGIIGMFVGPIYIIENIYHFVRSSAKVILDS